MCLTIHLSTVHTNLHLKTHSVCKIEIQFRFALLFFIKQVVVLTIITAKLTQTSDKQCI